MKINKETFNLTKESVTVKAVAEICQKINPKLENHEKLHNIVVIRDAWTIENNLLTPTMKIKRNAIEKTYKSNYVAWYEGNRVAIID